MNWSEFAAAAPELAADIAARIDGSRHSLLGSLRADGFPRISGVMTVLAGDELAVVTKPGSAMASDLSRDERCSLHSGPRHDEGPPMDFKLHARARSAPEDAVAGFVARLPHEPSTTLALFALDLVDASVVRLTDARDAHVVDSWQADRAGTERRVR